MKFLIPLAIILALTTAPMAGAAQDNPAEPEERSLIVEVDSLDEFLFVAVPLIIFADTPDDPRFIRQLDLLEARKQTMLDRDVVVITDTDPANPSDLRRQFRPRGFSVVLVDKNGRVNLRKPEPWDVRELSRTIDRM